MKTCDWLPRTGAPLLLLETRLLAHWRGSDPAHLGGPTDYDRICAATGDPSRCCAILPVGSGSGLVFGDDPGEMHWIPTKGGGGLLIRCVCGDSNESVLEDVRLLRAGPWTGRRRRFEPVRGFRAKGAVVVFDSAYSGADLIEDRTEALAFDLEPAVYAVTTELIESTAGAITFVHALEREAPGRR